MQLYTVTRSSAPHDAESSSGQGRYITHRAIPHFAQTSRRSAIQSKMTGVAMEIFQVAMLSSAFSDREDSQRLVTWADRFEEAKRVG